MAAGRRPDCAAGDVAARQGDSNDARVLDQTTGCRTGHEHGPEDPVREASGAEHLFDGEGALRHVGGVLEDSGVARHQRRRGKAEQLPEREIPRHDGQHRAERRKLHVAVGGARRMRLRCQEALGVVGEVGAGPRTFLDLGFGFDDGLAHFSRGERRQATLLGPQIRRRGAHAWRAVGEGHAAPRRERTVRTGQRRLDLGVGRRRKPPQHLFGCRVDRLDDLLRTHRRSFASARLV